MPRNGAKSDAGRSLSPLAGIAVVVGVVVGVGIFKTPSLVAASAGTGSAFLLLWLAGGAVSLLGALCYSELAAAHPHAGGEYHFLSRAYGRVVGFLFAWCRIAVIQTGAIAAVAFVLGDYAAQLVHLGPYGPAIYAGLAVAGLTALNAAGRGFSMRTQGLLTGGTVLALAALVVAGLLLAPNQPSAAAPGGGQAGVTVAGSAMIFVLLTYGGWNEAAYLSGELRDVQRNMVRILLVGLGLITALYLALNAAYLSVLGLAGMRQSDAVAADLLRTVAGEGGAQMISLLVVAATLSTLNATIFTGARTTFALGRDHSLLRALGTWNEHTETPVNAVLLQGAIALALIGLGSVTRNGFATMVEFTAPAFWLFFLLTGASLFVLRRREPGHERPFRVPLYPITPLVFCATCVFMLHASVVYTGIGALVGIALLLAGLPLLLAARRAERNGP